MIKIIVLVTILGWAKLICAEPQNCYDCSDTSTCDDPVNTALLDTCYWLYPTRDILANFDVNLFSKFNISVTPDKILKNPLEPVALKTGRSCVKYILSDGIRKSTTRMCGAKYGDGKDICQYVKDKVNLNGIKFTCRSCDTDYCNSSSKISFSILSSFGLIALLYLLK